MMRSKLNRRNLTALLLLLIPIWLIGISNFFFSSPSFTHINQGVFDRDSATNVFPHDVLDVIGYEWEGNTFTAIDQDPHFYIAPRAHLVASVLIALEKPVQSDHSITVYYAMSYQPLRTPNSVTAILPEGSSELVINLPASFFTTLRIDIDIFNEPFELQGIYLSETATSVRQWTGNLDGVLMTLSLSIFTVALWVAGLYTGYLDKYIERILEWCLEKIRFIRENPRKVMLTIGIFIAIFILACAAELFFHWRTPYGRLVRIVRVLSYVTAGLSVYLIIIFRGKPEKLFVSLSLLIGTLFVASSPFFWYGADQQIQYAWAVEESFIRTVSVSRADWILANCAEGNQILLGQAPPIPPHLPILQPHLPSARDNEILYTFTKGADTLSKMGFEFSGTRTLYMRLAHIPVGLMIYIGRSLAIAPLIIIRLGMLCNHLVYTAIVYLAMKRLTSGKYLLAIIAMFPTSFVLSTTYSYDYWLTAFIMLGLAYFFYEVQNPDEKISLKNIIIMIGAFVIGLGPKAIYVPLMLMLFFIKKDKFKTQKGHLYYIIGVSCAAIFVLGSFALPFLTSGGGWVDDYRGGGVVDSRAQTLFILQNPFAYARILLRFVRDYLINIHTARSDEYLQYYVTFFIHLRSSSFYYIIWALLGFVTLTDRSEKDVLSSTIAYKALVSFLVLSTFALLSTSLYISFTSVGAETIEGMQGRYLIPFLFPFFYVVGGFRVQNKMNESVYSIGVFGIMSYVLLTGVWQKLLPAFMMR